MTFPHRFLFLLASSRLDGNSEYLARQAASRLPETAETRWMHLEDHPLTHGIHPETPKAFFKKGS